MRLLKIGILTALVFAMVACANQPVVTYDTPLTLGKKVEPPRTQVASLWNPSSADAQIIPSYPSSGGGGASSTIYPALVPTAGQVAIGNAGGTAYAPVTLSGCVVSSAGVVSGCTTAAGGTGTTIGAPACVAGGSITNNTAVTPDFTGTNCYTFTLASPSTAFSLVNPTNLPTNAIIYIAMSEAATGSMAITAFGTHYFGMVGTAGNNYAIQALDTTHNAHTFRVGQANTTGTDVQAFWSDGTNVTLIPGTSPSGNFQEIWAGSTSTGALTINGLFTGGTNNITTTTGQIATTGGGVIQTAGGTVPTVAGGCGAGNVNAGSTNNRGSVTTGTTETTCQVVFSASSAFTNAPFCVCEDANGSAAPLGCSVSATTTAHFSMTFAAATAKVFNWLCF